mgnify:CR=1 FL=1
MTTRDWAISKMRRLLVVLLCLGLIFWPQATAWSQGACSTYRSWITGDSLTAGDLNSSFSTVGQTNMLFSCLDDYSNSVDQARTTTDPLTATGELSASTTGQGEIERIRFMFATVLGLGYWYKHNDNINFTHGSGIQGAGLGRHVTAVGLHVWQGSARFPSITSVITHTTGFFFPAAHHVAMAIDPATDRDKAGVETFRWHATAFTMHHTVALRFTHSQAFAANWQYPHITAVSVTQPQRGPDGTLPTPVDGRGIDQLVFGHLGTVSQFVGYGASHVGLGARGYYAAGLHVGVAPAPVPNALYASSMIRAWAVFSGNVADIAVIDGWNVAGVTDAGPGQYIVRWITPFTTTLSSYTVLVTASSVGGPLVGTLESLSPAHAVVRTWSGLGSPGTAADSGYVSVIAIGPQ